MHEPLSVFDLVTDELSQRRETGHDTVELQAVFDATAEDDVEALERILADLERLPRRSDWPYEEPEGLSAILGSLDRQEDELTSLDDNTLADKILGGWLGRIAGCNLGKPVEDGEHWTTDHLRDYLVRADAWPLIDYIPVLDPLPTGFHFRDNWVNTTRGRVNGSDRDDDIDYAILGVLLLQQHGLDLEARHVAAAWLTLLPYYQVYTAERAAYRNLLHGIPVAQVAHTRNPYREWIGALIRGDAFGWVNPGRPLAAARLAYQDASLSHVANGVYGEMWSAALVAAAFTAESAREAIDVSLTCVPPRSRLAEALGEVASMRDQGLGWEAAVSTVQAKYGHYSWVHTVNNAAIIAAGLLWGDGDFSMTVGLTVAGGWDTDSNGATAGSVAGVLAGAAALPGHFVEPLHDRTRSAVFGYDNSAISDLARRTTALAIALNATDAG
jgi:ADP-ribosylglycohydrolase